MRSQGNLARARSNSPLAAGALVWLAAIELSPTETLRACSDTAPLAWAGNTYQPLPFAVGSITEDLDGGLPGLRIDVANESAWLSRLIESGGGLQGRDVTLTLVDTAILDDGQPLWSEDFQVDSLSANASEVRIGLAAVNLLAVPFPRRRFNRSSCTHAYQGSACAYAGALATCSRSLVFANGCREHDNVGRYGGFPGIPPQ